jgi:hypothetical protein
LDFFNDNGYLVVKDAISDESIDKLLQRTDKIIEENDIVEKQVFFIVVYIIRYFSRQIINKIGVQIFYKLVQT